jgi:transposase
MRQIREVLRLHHEGGLGARKIAQALDLSKSAIAEYLRAAQRAGIGWPIEEGISETELQSRLFPPSGCSIEKSSRKTLPDCEWIHTELLRKGVTLALLWEEYLSVNPGGYRYTQFCHHYQRWAVHLDVTMRQRHVAGEKLFVDYSGQTIGITDPKSGEIWQAEVFVAVLGASNYTYVEASRSQELDCWIASHVRAFEYFGGVPSILVPDNLKSGITKPCRYEPVINRTYEELAIHYGTVVIPTRIAAPRDKAKVEGGVLIAQRWILARLRHRVFYSIDEANEAIWAALEDYNARQMQGIGKSRREMFDKIEREALKPLPPNRYVRMEFCNCRVNIDYHIEVEKHYYSVPHMFARERVEARFNSTIVEIFHDGRRIASHPRSYYRHKHTTLPEHMPKAHQRYAEWTPSRIISWGRSKSEEMAVLFDKIMESRRHPEQGFRSCLGIIGLEKRYGIDRLIAACRKVNALKAHASAYRTIKNMLLHKTEMIPLLDAPMEHTEASSAQPKHSNVRGGSYYLPENLPDADAILRAEGGLQ